MLLGIDVGTSGLKAMLLNPETGMSILAYREYDVTMPKTGFAEQSPDLWWKALIACLNELRAKNTAIFEKIDAIGFSGQMHGLVMVGKNKEAVTNAILWLDQRSERQTRAFQEKIPSEEIATVIQNRPFPGFAVPSFMWIQENEKDIYRDCYKIMQPKDYLRMKLTGTIGTEVSDASATAGFDIKNRKWAFDLLDKLGLDPEKFPDCRESVDLAGVITAEAAKATGLRKGIPVVFGAGDQQAQSIGNGAVCEGLFISNIGTGGQIATYSEKDIYDKKLRTHTFCHAVNKAYTIYGAALCSGMSIKWLKNNVFDAESYDEISALAQQAPPCSEELIYLPYLAGERTPHMDPKARGIFFGLTMRHDKRHFARAVMEGVTFSLRDSLELFEKMNLPVERIIASGGGANSKIWLRIQADIFGKEIVVSDVREQACLGACILAGIGTGMFGDVQEAVRKLVTFKKETYEPDMKAHERYGLTYRQFQKIYDANKELFAANGH